MTQIYKALVEFELDGAKVGIGQEVALRAREGEELQKAGTVAPVDRELDPATEADAALIAKCDARAEESHADVTSDLAAREESADVREKAVDEKNAEEKALVEKQNEVVEGGEPATEADAVSTSAPTEEAPAKRKKR